MSKLSEEMWHEYQKMITGMRIASNPWLNESKEKREVYVACICDKQYLVWLNGNIPIPEYKDLLIVCPHCHERLEDAVLLAGHEGGVFNLIRGILLDAN